MKKIDRIAAERGCSTHDLLMDVMRGGENSANKACGEVGMSIQSFVPALERNGWTRTGTSGATRWHPPETPTPNPSPKHEGGGTKKRDERCSLCGRTRDEAAVWAAVGVRCTACAPVITHSSAEGKKVNPEVLALMVDVDGGELLDVQVSVIDRQPIPGAADLRLLMLNAHDAGRMIVRRHRVTEGNHG